MIKNFWNWFWNWLDGEPWNKPSNLCTEYGCISGRAGVCGGDLCYKHCILWHTDIDIEGNNIRMCNPDNWIKKYGS